MELDFSGLEEVRGELESWQDITKRPILTKIRNLSRKRLAALGILCCCDGQASFEQVWALEYIFNGNKIWTKEALEAALSSFLEEGIVDVREEIIYFSGDDFDKIYVKYFALEQGVALSLSPLLLEQYWQKSLESMLERSLHDRLSTFMSPQILPQMRQPRKRHLLYSEEEEGETSEDEYDILSVAKRLASTNLDIDLFVKSEWVVEPQ